jgi:hypothetical protein
MNQCCPSKSLCIDPADPVQNFSAEAPDQIEFIGFNTGWDNSDGGYNTPSIGTDWGASGCESTCISTVSQAEADQCAANQQLACADGTWSGGRGVPNFLNDSVNCVSLCPDGIPFNFTIPAGSILALSLAQANAIAGSFACTNAALRKICLSSLSVTEACANSKYSGTITASGGLASPFANTWVIVAGSLPAGLSFPGVAGRTLVISGTPTVGGNYPFTMRITAPNGDFMQKQFSLCIIDFTPASLPGATIGTAYSSQLTAPSCANQSQSWQVTSGALPAGLTINEQTGLISGTPSGPSGVVSFTIKFQDQAS